MSECLPAYLAIASIVNVIFGSFVFFIICLFDENHLRHVLSIIDRLQ